MSAYHALRAAGCKLLWQVPACSWKLFGGHGPRGEVSRGDCIMRVALCVHALPLKLVETQETSVFQKL
jgi:hypothetical protein